MTPGIFFNSCPVEVDTGGGPMGTDDDDGGGVIVGVGTSQTKCSLVSDGCHCSTTGGGGSILCCVGGAVSD